MLEYYKTILKEAEAEIVEKKSRFLATVRPVTSEEEAKLFIDEMKKKYWNATHNVFAYQIGERNELQRFHDDGEPPGTAGMPILNVLKGEDIKNTAIVVTRYFGGTLLGTGGLVRAYGKAAKEGILASGIAQMILYATFRITSNYADSGKIQYEVLQDNHIIHDTTYTENVTFQILVEYSQAEAFYKNINNITKGNAIVDREPERYGAWDNEKLHIYD